MFYEVMYCAGDGTYRGENFSPEDVELDLDENYVRVYDKESGALCGAYNKDYVIAVRLVIEEEDDEQT